MNHIARDFRAPDGSTWREHGWEVREGGYRRLALVFGYPTWPIARERRLVRFLLERGFLVRSLEVGFGEGVKSRSLSSLRTTAAAWARSLSAQTGLPLYLLPMSFSSALLPAFKGLPALAAAALVAPVLSYPPPGTRMPRWFFQSTAELDLGKEGLSGKPELLAEVMESPAAPLRFRKHDLRSLAGEDLAAHLAELGIPAAVFLGEDDPLAPPAARETLAATGIKLHAYPRVRHAPAHDRYADNFFADLGAFMDEVEVSRARAGTKP